jgi:hypothetical protein
MISRRGASRGLAAALIVGALAVVPTVASAAATSVLPGTKEAEWVGVNCTVVSTSKACSETPFQMWSTSRILKHNGEKVWKCESEFEGHFEADGTAEVTAGWASGLGWCGSTTLNFEKKWPGEICEWHKGKKEDQAWMRLEIHERIESAGIELNGPIYLHLETTAGANGDPLEIGRAVAPNSEIGDTSAPLNEHWTYTADGTTESSTPYVFTVSEAFPQTKVESNEKAACKWAELE